MKPSEIWSAAAKAAEEALPAESRGKLTVFDFCNRAWVKAGCPWNGDEIIVHAKRKAVEADSLAMIALELRNKACDALIIEQNNKPLLTPEQAAYALREAAR